MLVEYTLNFKTLETHFIVATYFAPRFFVKNEKFSNQLPILFLIIFKVRIKKKNIRNVHKMFYTYYHGCHGNIFFSKNYENCSNQAHFFYITFKARM